ncbi:MAG TPA: hypothetical protein PLF42_06590 [Anaerolineales bacterium]|nr:hypothetical protein [Anaerolineales bacterium]
MKIEFERSGGFMGRTVSLSLDLDDLPADQAQALRLLIDNADFFNLPADSPNSPARDAFSYTVAVTDGARQHTVHTDDVSAPESLRPLLMDLSARARGRR